MISAELPLPPTKVVSSFLETTLLIVPKSSSSADSNLRPTSSVITLAPVNIAISCNISLRLSPKPGALTARAFRVPLILLTTSVASASPSTSSAITTMFLLPLSTFSSKGNRSETADIFLSVTKT